MALELKKASAYALVYRRNVRGKRKTLTIQCTKCDAKVIYDGKESDDGKVMFLLRATSKKLNHKCRNPMMEAYLEATKISAEAKEESGEEHPPTFAALDEARSYIQREVPSMVSRHGKHDRVISNCRDTNCKAQLEYKLLGGAAFLQRYEAHASTCKGPRRIVQPRLRITHKDPFILGKIEPIVSNYPTVSVGMLQSALIGHKDVQEWLRENKVQHESGLAPQVPYNLIYNAREYLREKHLGNQSSYRSIPSIQRYFKLCDEDTRLLWKTNDGQNCGGIYESMSLICGSTKRMLSGYGMKNILAIDAAHPYQLGSMRREGKYYFSVMEDANCNAHIISVGHGPHESIEGWEAFLRPIRNTVARIDKSKFEEVVEETRRGRSASRRRIDWARHAFICDEHSSIRGALERIGEDEGYEQVAWLLCKKHKSQLIKRHFPRSLSGDKDEAVRLFYAFTTCPLEELAHGPLQKSRNIHQARR